MISDFRFAISKLVKVGQTCRFAGAVPFQKCKALFALLFLVTCHLPLVTSTRADNSFSNIVATITITNTVGTTNGNNFKLYFGADTSGYNYIFTNVWPAVPWPTNFLGNTNVPRTTFHYVAATNTAAGAATNLYVKLKVDWTNKLSITMTAATVLKVETFPNVLVRFTNSITPGWGTITWRTNFATNNASLASSNFNASSITLGGSTITNWNLLTNSLATTNYVLTQGLNQTNDTIARIAAIGLAATNYALALGVNVTNYVLAQGVNQTNHTLAQVAAVGLNATNFANTKQPAHLSLSNVVNVASNTYYGNFIVNKSVLGISSISLTSAPPGHITINDSYAQVINEATIKYFPVTTGTVDWQNETTGWAIDIDPGSLIDMPAYNIFFNERLIANPAGPFVLVQDGSEAVSISSSDVTIDRPSVVFTNDGVETVISSNTITTGSALLTNFLNIPNAAAPTTDAFGEIAGDNNAWAASRGALQIFDGTANTYAVATLASDTPSNGQVPQWNTGTITWETPSVGSSPTFGGQFSSFDGTTNFIGPLTNTIARGGFGVTGNFTNNLWWTFTNANGGLVWTNSGVGNSITLNTNGTMGMDGLTASKFVTTSAGGVLGTAALTSTQFLTMINNETGSGAVVGGTSPTLSNVTLEQGVFMTGITNVTGDYTVPTNVTMVLVDSITSCTITLNAISLTNNHVFEIMAWNTNLSAVYTITNTVGQHNQLTNSLVISNKQSAVITGYLVTNSITRIR